MTTTHQTTTEPVMPTDTVQDAPQGETLPGQTLQTAVTPERLDKISAAAYRIRHHALNMGEVQGQGYVGQALGAADMLATVYGDQLNFRAEDPHWEARDRFLLS